MKPTRDKDITNKQMFGDITLGIDMGTNSIGWALIEHDENQNPTGLLHCGVRIFQEAVNAKTRTPKNQDRRTARAARRLLSRRSMRRSKLRNVLVLHHLLPAKEEEQKIILTDLREYDPYQLRAQGLDQPLTLYQLGRALYHLNQRRGFLTNRKTASKDEGKVKSAIGTLEKEIKENKCRTLGEFLSKQSKKRNRYTNREMYKEEFELLWKAQEKFHRETLTTPLKVAIYNTLFFQRPLKIQKHLVGKCTLEPSRKRAGRAMLESQRFRYLQDVNNLQVKNPITRDWRFISLDEKQKLIPLLERQETLIWGKARKILGLHEGERFNLEETEKKKGKNKLFGNRTAHALRSVLGDQWDSFSDEKKQSLIADMLTIDNEKGFLNRMENHWKFDKPTAEKLATTELESGYARLSLKAIKALLPFLERGLTYDKACEAAGYHHSATALALDKLGLPPMLRNPVVEKALYEVRKLVHAILRVYGKPNLIRVEMARDMKLTKKQKEEEQKKQKEIEKKRERARNILRTEFGMTEPSREDILKYQLWEESKCVCPYTETSISREMLFSSEVEIEHILPYSQSLDDSYMNKTLCMAQENRNVKKNQTPYEAYHTDTQKYEEILQRVKDFPDPKLRRFEQKEVDTDQFVERQLNDTRYICRETRNYLQQLGIPVDISKGEATAVLRYKWGLNRILSSEASSKNREDHRHHAIDAVVIALTSRSLFQKLSRLSAHYEASLSEHPFYLEEPWQGFAQKVSDKISPLIVSHAPMRKLSGALHEATAYGYGQHKQRFVYVFRKPVDKLTPDEIEFIRDDKVKELIQARIQPFGDITQKTIKQALGDPTNNPVLHVDGKTPIRSVRIVRNFRTPLFSVQNEQQQPYKYYEYGNNHHVEIIEHVETGAWEGRFVTTMEAARRARMEKKPMVQRDHGKEYCFIMSLSINDMVELEWQENRKFYRVQLLDASEKNVIFRLHTAAKLDNKDTRLQIKAHLLKKLNPIKVIVDPLGRVGPCHD